MSANEPQFTTAEAPFNDPKADVILRSSDNIDFRTFKSLLSLASTVFDDMFGWPQPPAAGSDDTKRTIEAGQLPVVTVSEPSRTVRNVLMFCHPKCSPELDNISEINEVTAMGLKYDMEGLVGHARQSAKRLSLEVMKEPIRAYAIACRYKLKQEMKLAAKATLALPLSNRSSPVELELISAADLQRVIAYHDSCAKATVMLGSTTVLHCQPRFDWIYSQLDCTCKKKFYHNRQYPTWWVEYAQKVDAALQIQPCGDTVRNTQGLLDETAKAAMECNKCIEKALADIHRFNENLALAVEEAVSKEIIRLGDSLNARVVCVLDSGPARWQAFGHDQISNSPIYACRGLVDCSCEAETTSPIINPALTLARDKCVETCGWNGWAAGSFTFTEVIDMFGLNHIVTPHNMPHIWSIEVSKLEFKMTPCFSSLVDNYAKNFDRSSKALCRTALDFILDECLTVLLRRPVTVNRKLLPLAMISEYMAKSPLITKYTLDRKPNRPSRAQSYTITHNGTVKISRVLDVLPGDMAKVLGWLKYLLETTAATSPNLKPETNREDPDDPPIDVDDNDYINPPEDDEEMQGAGAGVFYETGHLVATGGNPGFTQSD
ncbi:hypothetical protein PILCRDRAFT_84944 [Piloderma croceum F 1598]|uniref:BTB domain-containing protein n=1 Tax=Piloderma croceum (strain F 1598) TaxID=765440 RepID=A0A0C3GEX4_PILCF|nr:hypothetical protein PILCRDRAFT_84944 [Piloderma croceum F 1598]